MCRQPLLNLTMYVHLCVYRKCCGHSLYLLEMSLDCSLAHAALQLEMKDGSCVLPNVTVQELEGNSVAVLFATSSCVFRLLLPHPDTISKVVHYLLSNRFLHEDSSVFSFFIVFSQFVFNFAFLLYLSWTIFKG